MADATIQRPSDHLNGAMQNIGYARAVLDTLYEGASIGGEAFMEQLPAQSLATTLHGVNRWLEDAEKLIQAGWPRGAVAPEAA